MGRTPCCFKVGLHRGFWTVREDTLLINYIQAHGEGLLRCGKSCRLRWLNYLRPDIKRGYITPDEDDLIIRLHSLLSNSWSLIAKRLPGRIDNEIKNYWHCQLSKSVQKPVTHSNTSEESASRSSRSKAMKTTEKKRKISKEKQESKGATPTVTMAKVHQPKACRVSPFSVLTSSRFDSMISRSPSGGEGAKGLIITPAFFILLLIGLTLVQLLLLIKNFLTATAFLDATPVGDDSKMLDDIFEELPTAS